MLGTTAFLPPLPSATGSGVGVGAATVVVVAMKRVRLHTNRLYRRALKVAVRDRDSTSLGSSH